MLADVLQSEPGFRMEQPRVLIVEDEFLIAMDIEDSILQADEEADVIGIANKLDDAVALGRRADRQARSAGCSRTMPHLCTRQTRRHPCRDAHRHDGIRLRYTNKENGQKQKSLPREEVRQAF